MRATIRDVARSAGVSIATVSRVLNDTCPVSRDKRLRVEDAVKQLGYTPNPNARTLLKQETGGVGVLVPSVSEEFFAEFLTGIDRCTQENGYYLLISSSHRNRREFEQALASMYRRVDGLLVMAPDQMQYDPDHPVLRDTPSVYINTNVRSGTPALSVDNEGGVRGITEHLLSKGHKRLAMIEGPRNVNDSRERKRGFTAALKAYGIARGNWVTAPGQFTWESGYEAAQRIMTSQLNPTAIVAANDLSALGALSYLKKKRIRVPDDVMLSGFDDISAARYSSPPLTTVRVPIRELGERAVLRLISLIKDESTGRKSLERLPVKTVLRASTGD